MNVSYNKKFLKQLANLPKTHRIKIENFVFENLINASSIQQLGNIEKIQGYSDFYKVRFGVYRLGLQIKGENIFVKTVLHRKEIYKFFP